MIEALRRELGAVGIRGRRRERILAEITDHLASSPNADLGDPRRLAAQFADELATGAARSRTLATFGALSIVACALVATQTAIPTYPDVTSGSSPVLAAAALIFVVVGAQVAFVAGSLGALRAFRLRGEVSLAGAEVGVLRRRNAVALAAGATTLAGIVLYAINFWGELPAWVSLLTVAVAAVGVPPLAAAALMQLRAARWSYPSGATRAASAPTSDRSRARP